MSKCTPFTTDDWESEPTWRSLLRCPNCSGWLPRDWPIGEQFLCKRCGAVLETQPSIPDSHVAYIDGKTVTEEEDSDYKYGGRLCVVPPEAVTISTVLPPKKIRRRRKRTTQIAHGLLFTRRVWKDRDGTFIEVGGERILINDPRIQLITEDVSP